MLDRIITRERGQAMERILYHYRDHYHPYAFLAPSGRFGLYAAAKELLPRGSQVLVSPVTCKTVMQALLAAGLHPVFVDIELETGNIDVTRLSASLLRSARAIVTTNLYGNPDAVPELARIAKSYQLLLIEDCAHVLRTSIGGQPVGGLGDVAVFSFKKYFDETGGVVAVRNAAAARRLQACLANDTRLQPGVEERRRYLQHLLAQSTSQSTATRISALYRRLCAGHRSDANRLSPVHAVMADPGPGNTLPTTAGLLRVAAILDRCEDFVNDRKSAARDLIARCPLPLKSSGDHDVCYLVVPFFCSRRDAVVAALQQRGIPTHFLYSRPMNQLFPAFHSNHLLDSDGISYWCCNILPVNLSFGEQYLSAIECLTPKDPKDVCRNQKSA